MNKWINFILFIGMSPCVLAGSIPPSVAKYKASSAIATGHYLATQTAVQILDNEGNAFDAAVAVAAVLAVVQPYGSGLGGGGFWLLHDAKANKDIFIDSREMAPQTATNAQLLQNIPALTSGIPGEPAAFDYIAKKYGQLPLKKLLAPAINFAQNGFSIDERYLYWINQRKEALLNNKAARSVFFNEGEHPEPKIWVQQPDLAKTLSILAEKGASEFYQGEMAQKIVAAVQQQKGTWTLADLKNYQIKIRQPIQQKFKDFTFVTVGEPSAGGYTMMAMLEGLAGYPNWKTFNKVEQLHFFAELMRRANSERRYYTDPDFQTTPVPHLSANRYFPDQAQAIDLKKATPSAELTQTKITMQEGEHTTFFVIVDNQGNRAAVNLSLNDMFGSGIMVPGLGFLLNDELTDFTPEPATSDNKNQVAPNKRPLSSMAPSFYEDACRLIITGTPGGQRIPTMQFLVLAAMIQNVSLPDALKQPRLNQKYLPDILEVENTGFDETTLNALRKMGHSIKTLDSGYGDMQAVMYNRCNQDVMAVSDPRGVGFAVD